MGAEAPKTPKLRLRTLPGGMVLEIIATALGIINAPPRPDRALKVRKANILVQKPQASVQADNHVPPTSTSNR